MVTKSRKRRNPAQGNGKADAVIRSVALAVCIVCAAFLAWHFAKGSGIAKNGGGAQPSEPAAPRPNSAVQVPQGASGSTEDGATPLVPGGSSAQDRLAAGDDKDAAVTQPRTAAISGSDSAAERPSSESAASMPDAQGNSMPQEKEYFNNDVENFIASFSEPGAEFLDPQPRVDLPREEIIALLKQPVEIFDDDDAEAIAVKERTAEFKSLALTAMEKDGLTFNQFIRDLAHMRNEEAAQREDARTEMLKILKEQGEDEARAYLNEVNAELKALGMKELALPDRIVIKYLRQKENQ